MIFLLSFRALFLQDYLIFSRSLIVNFILRWGSVMRILKYLIIIIIIIIFLGIGTILFVPGLQSLLYPHIVRYNSSTYQIPIEERSASDWIVIGAKEEVIKRVKYDASYQNLDYPMGDVESGVGACTDVVIRALRKAGYDLQELIHEDMKANFNLYPNRWGLTKPDFNIDHRRVPNQIIYFERFGTKLPKTYNEETKESWQSGDIVYWKMPSGLDHTGVISDRQDRSGIPLVIHNAFVTIEDDALLRWEIIGHYRYPKVE